MNNSIIIKINDKEISIPYGLTLLQLYNQVKDDYPQNVVGATINNYIFSMDTPITRESTIKFLSYKDINGYKIYQNGLYFLLIVAASELWGKNCKINFLNSLDKGTYIKIDKESVLTFDEVASLKNKMIELINEDIPFIKNIVKKKDAINYFNAIGEKEKAQNIHNIANATVVLYKLKNLFNYFYSDMPYSTKCLDKFELIPIKDNHIILNYPNPNSNGEIGAYFHFDKTLEIFEKYRSWLYTLKLPYVADLNNIIVKNKISDFISINTIFIEESINEITSIIYDGYRKNEISAIFISGPSSSGKTTTSKKLGIHLKRYGLNPIIISIDDYYKERIESPKDEKGEYDFECLEAIDVELLTKQMNSLFNNEEVSIPTYNFFTGNKEYKGRIIQLKENDIIIFEGLHCLNPALTNIIPKNKSYKIYLSPFTGLSIDRHNKISNLDIRLIRRIVRDNVFRGYTVEETIKSWQKVRAGEEKYIYPFQNHANYILNTSLIYEIGVLKVFAEPLLYSVKIDSPYYEEARRLLGYLRCFFTISPSYVPTDSILREFIGGSTFNE